MTLQWLTSPEWANIVKALLHTLWQGAVLAVLLGIALRHLHNPVARYRSSLAALAGVLIAGLVTWALLNQPMPQSISPAPIPVAAAVAAPMMESNFSTVVVNVPLAQPKRVELGWTAWLALIWLAGAVVMLGRAVIQVAGAEQLRRAALPLDDSRIAELLAEARRAVGLARRVRLAVTDQLTSPAVVGVLVPTLILPLSLTASLTHEQIRFILLHELAHIRRGDYFANLFQLFAEALLFFNPAVWWISRQMRLEREACCDALAIELSGAPADYARTLVHVAENILQPAPAAANAFGDKREPSSLADRVQRMLVPGYRPKLRLTWRAMLAALFVGGALLTLSAIGTRVTVAAILSPEQRIERIEKKMTALGEKPVAANYSDDEHAPQVKISGIIRTADGSPVPKWVNLSFNSTAGRSSYGTGYSAKNGKFSTSVRAGIIQIGVEAKDFAPFALAPLDGLATNSFENIEIILERGFEATLQVVDADSQKPLPDVRVATIYWIGHSGFQSRSTNTDASGVITLPHSADLPIDATINTPGYEITKKHFDHVRANEPLRVSLRRGATLTGTVLDKLTGKPLAGAEFHLLFQAAGEDAGHFEWNDAMHTLGSSGADGAFVMNQLRGGVKYYLGVSAPGHESVILNNIFTGNSNLVVQLGPEIIVRGHVNGSLDELQIINHDRTLEANTSENFENNSQGHSEWVVLHETNGVVTFQFTNRVAGLVTLTGRNGFREEREVTAPIDDWIVNIAEKRSREAKFLPKREVVFRFKHPSGVAPRGTVEVLVPDNLDPQHGTAHYEELQITNSEIRTAIAFGGRTSIVPKRMVGFWFNRTGKWTSPTGEHGDWMSIEVGSHATPLVIEVPLIPAGAIYARAKNADGTPAGGLFFGVTELKRAPGRDQNSLDNGSDNLNGDAPRQWISGPLPLGGKYQIHAWRGNSFCVSGPVKLTESEPDAEVELQFAPGKTVSGVLLDADGKPLRDVELKTTFNFPDNHGFGLKSVFTDEQGRFQLTDTTPDVGEYSIETAVPGLLAEKVVLNFGAQPQVIRLKRGRTLAGRVVDSVSGQPIPEMEVRALDYESNKLPMQTAHTDADGHFEFASLGDANYTLYPDGGELLGRPRSGNLKFRADGRTNLVLIVKLYEWSKLKPKAAPANSGTIQTKGILSDPNFRTVLKALEQRGGFSSLGEPEVTTYSGRGENRMSLPITVQLKPATNPPLVGIVEDPNFRTVLRTLEQRGIFDSLGEPVVTTTSGRMTQLRNENQVENVAGLVAQSASVSRTTNPPAVLIQAEIYKLGEKDFSKVLRDLYAESFGTNAKHNEHYVMTPEHFAEVQAYLRKAGFQPLMRPRILTASGQPAQFFVGDDQRGTELDCTPIVNGESINLWSSGTVDAPIHAKPQLWTADEKLQNRGGVLFRTKTADNSSASNSVILMSVEIVTNSASVRKPSATNALYYSGPARQSIAEKLNRIRLDSIVYDGVPLSEVLRQLAEKTRLADPEHKGINFLINPNADQAGPAKVSQPGFMPAVDPVTGLPVSPNNGGGVLDIGQFTVKLNLTNVLLADLLAAITNVAQNPTPDDSRKINFSVKDYGIAFQPDAAASPQFFTRQFKVDTNTFYLSLKQAESAGASAATNFSATVSASARRYFSGLGVDLDSPPGKAIFYNYGSGRLLVRATEQDLDLIERFIRDLNEPPPLQIHIKARFLEVTHGGASGLNLFLGQQPLPVGNVPTTSVFPGSMNGVPPVNPAASVAVPAKPSGAPQLVGILTKTNFTSILHALESRGNVESLGEPEVTTLSGRQTQMHATQLINVVTNFAFLEDATNGPIVPQMEKIETGPILDVVPYVLADGYTINLSLIPSVTDFLGYDSSTNTTTAYNRAGKKFDVPTILPRFNIRQVVATLNLWDGQTAVIGGIPSVNYVNGNAAAGKPKASDKELLIFITADIVDPAGNRVHSDEQIESAHKEIPVPPPMLLNK